MISSSSFCNGNAVVFKLSLFKESLTLCGSIQLEKLIEAKYIMVNRKDGSKLSSKNYYTMRNIQNKIPNQVLLIEN